MDQVWGWLGTVLVGIGLDETGLDETGLDGTGFS